MMLRNPTVRCLALTAILLGFGAPITRASELLATGDSMIGLTSDFMHDDYTPEGVTVDRQPVPGSGLTKPFVLNWEGYAKRQVEAFAPDVVVIALGANDDHPLGPVACCSPRWVAKYVRHVNRMIRSYTENGTTVVYWLTLPAPRPPRPQTRRTYIAVNHALHVAVADHPGVAHIVNVARIISPGFRYDEDIEGQDVREPDGIHLAPAGARLVATAVEQQLANDGVLPMPSR